MNQQRDRRVPDHDPVCIECGGIPKLVGGQEIYPHRPDLYQKRFYLCQCGAYVGCHPDSDIALGNPCGPATRKARGEAHAAIDPIWRDKLMRRSDVYYELAKRMRIDRDICHIAHMDRERALQAAAIGRQLRKEKDAKG